MELIWAKYHNSSKFYLLLSLGESKGKVISLSSDHIPDSEMQSLRTVFSELQAASLSEKLKWIKKYMPYSAKNAFRTFNKASLIIKEKYKPFST